MPGIVADKVIVELEAKLERYNANVNNAVRVFETGTTRMRNDAAAAERQITKSFDGIKKALLASTGLFLGAQGLAGIEKLADGYTRFTNQLKLAGNEGSKLGVKQEALFQIAQKYGVELEAVGTLYGRVSQASKELGSTEGQVLQFTNAVAAALKVQGGAASESRGALLQLSQMLGAPIVQAQEFNSVLDGARPIIQAVANGIDKYGGSIAKLRMDVIQGAVTSKDFFAGFLRGSAKLEEQAAHANLTIGASFTILNNALGRYIGHTDQSLSLTQRFAQAMGLLANNLDVIVPALAGIAVGYGAIRLGAAVFDGVALATGRALEIDKELSRAILLGNASYISRTGLVLASATAASEAAAAEVAAVQATVVARQEDLAAAAALVAQEQTLVAAMGQDVAARETLIAATVQHTAAAQALAAAEVQLAAAEGVAVVAEEAEAVAVTEASLAKRAGVAITALFSGVLTTMGAALPLVAIAALTAGIIYYYQNAESATERTARFKQQGEDLAAHLAQVAVAARNAASSIAQVGNNAAGAASKMLAFAGATGEAAQRLYELAQARRHETLVSLQKDRILADQEAKGAVERVRSRRANQVAAGGGVIVNPPKADQEADAADKRIYWQARRRAERAQQGSIDLLKLPLTAQLSGSERENGRDVKGDLARVTRDLAIARERGIRSQVDILEAEKFELTQYSKYRKSGLSPQASADQSKKDAEKFKEASAGAQGDRDAKKGAAADRKAAAAARAAARKAAAAEKDDAADTARYTAKERGFNNEIAQARAELANSAEGRAQIEKDRIEDDRLNRNEEIRQSVRQGQLGKGEQARTRALELQDLNNQHAALATQVVDLHEKQRIAAEATQVASGNLRLEEDILKSQEPLADTNAERRRIALRLLDLQYQQERIELEAITVANGRTAAEEKLAQARLKQLDLLHANDRKAVERQNEGVAAGYLRGLNTKDWKEAFDEVRVDGLKALDDQLTSTISKVFQLGGAFGTVADKIISDLVRIAIERELIKPLANALFGSDGGSGGGGGGGFFGSLLGSIFGKGSGGGGGLDSVFGHIWEQGDGSILGGSPGFASGGHVSAGSLYRVNETGTEGFRPAGSGQIIPLGQMNGPAVAAGGGAATAPVVRFYVGASEYFDGRVHSISGNVAVETVQMAAPGLTDLAVSETFRRANRPEL